MAAVYVKGLLHFETDEEAKKFCKEVTMLDVVDYILNSVQIKSDNQVFSIDTFYGERLKRYETYCASEELQEKFKHGEIKDEDIGLV